MKTNNALPGEPKRSEEGWSDRTIFSIVFTALVPMVFVILVFAMAHKTDDITMVAPTIASLIVVVLWYGGCLAYALIRSKIAENKTLLNQILKKLEDLKKMEDS